MIVPMTDAELDAIAARLRGASPGPWHNRSMLFSAGWRAIVELSPWRFADLADPRNRQTDSIDHANAEFIAHARVDVRALYNEVRRLRSQVAQLQRGPA